MFSTVPPVEVEFWYLLFCQGAHISEEDAVWNGADISSTRNGNSTNSCKKFRVPFHSFSIILSSKFVSCYPTLGLAAIWCKLSLGKTYLPLFHILCNIFYKFVGTGKTLFTVISYQFSSLLVSYKKSLVRHHIYNLLLCSNCTCI